jgi:hypothetical protein
MAGTWLRFLPWLLSAALAATIPANAFDTRLSDTAVREAYFIGQRHDDSVAEFFEKYTKHLPPAKTGVYVSSVAFLTPFALAVEWSGRQVNGYSAQQAQVDHKNQGEFVKVVVQIDYVNAYAVVRPYAFWKDFDVRIFDNEKLLKPSSSGVDPNYYCSPEGGCTTTGVTLSFDFPAESFNSDSGVIQIDSPTGDPIIVNFDLTTFR